MIRRERREPPCELLVAEVPVRESTTSPLDQLESCLSVTKGVTAVDEHRSSSRFTRAGSLPGVGKKKAASSAKTSNANGTAANIGFEAKLWLAADKLRNNMDAAEYKHVVLGLIFLKYISDTFEEHRAKL